MSTVTTWYYVDRHDWQPGPLSREDLLHPIECERLSPDTLAWRDGLAQWEPQSSLAAELSLNRTVVPPPAAPPASSFNTSTPISFETASTQVVHAGFVRRWATLMSDGKHIWLTMDKGSGVTPSRHCSYEPPDRTQPMNCRESTQP